MKNIIPVITAVILGLASVFAVSRIMSHKAVSPEATVDIVATSQTLKANETIEEDFIYAKKVGVSSVPQQRILWENRSMVIGQKTLVPIAKNDFLLYSNVGLSSSMGNIIGKGEWGVTVSFADSTLLKVIQPGDEIAIVGIFKITSLIKTEKDTEAKPEAVTREVSTVIYPRVRILEKCGNNSVILSMPPQQALALINVQQRCKLYPLLRKTNDANVLNRKDGGIFEESTLLKLVDGLDAIEIPTTAIESK
jgi:Flp pilus assembly protein CpaB